MSEFITRDEFTAMHDLVQHQAEMIDVLSENVQRLAQNQQKDAELHKTHDLHIQELYRGGIALRDAYCELIGLNNPQKDNPQ